MNITIIIALLTSSLNFLTASVGTPMQPVAMDLATQAVNITQEFLATSPNLAPIPEPQISATSTIIFVPVPAPEPSSPIATQPAPTPQPKAHMTIELVNPPSSGKTYTAYDWDAYNNSNVPDSERPKDFVFPSNANSINIGAIVRDSNGNALNNVVVAITATDATQNKTLNSTGNVTPTYPGGVKKFVPYYPFSYLFKTSGEHTITFTVEGEDPVSTTVEVGASN